MIYIGIGGVCDSFNLILFSWVFITPGVSWRNVAEIVPLILYFLLTATLSPLWLLWEFSGASIGIPPR